MDEFEKEYAELASLYQRARSTAKTPEGQRMARADYDEAVREVARRQQASQRATQSVTQPSTPRRAPLSTGEKVAGTVRAAAQGASFGFGEEAEAVARSLASGRPYGEEVGALRQSMSRFREEYPKTAFAAEVGGGLVVPGLGAAKIAQTGVRGAKAVGAVSRSSAAQGALSGAGTAEGGVTERSIGAGIGSAGGALLGNVVGRGVEGVTAAISRLRGGGGVLPPAGIAEITKRAQQANIADLPQKLQEAATTRAPGTTVMDVIGAPGVRLASGIRTIGGEAGNVVEEAMQQRLATTPQRLQRAAFSTGRRAENVVTTIDDIVEQRRIAADPLYEAALGTDAPIVNAAIEELLDRPLFQRAVKLAEDYAKNAGQVLEYVDSPTGPVPVRTPAFLDNVKKALDDVIYGGRQPGEGGFGPGALKQAKSLRTSFVEMLDTAIPGYAEARAAYAGPTALKSAMEDGLDAGAKRLNPEELAKTVENLVESEREFFRRGYINALRQQIDEGLLKPGQVKTLAFAQRLRAVFGTEGDEVTKAIREEIDLSENAQRILASSRTAERQQDVAALTEATRFGDAVRATLRPRETALRALSAVEARATAPLSAGRRTATAEALMTPVDESDMLRAIIRREHLARVLGEGSRRVVGPAVGRLAGSGSANMLQSR